MVGAGDIDASSVDAVAWSFAAYRDLVSYTPPYAPLATPEHRYPWASFRHDNLNTGYQPAYEPTNLTLQWQRDLGNGAINAPIAVVNGFSYVVTSGVMNMTAYKFDTNSAVYCLNSTGATVWKADIGKGYQVAAPLVYGGKVIVASADGKVYAFDIEDGSTEWTYDTGTALSYGVTSSPIVYQNKIIFAATDGKVYTLHENGTEALDSQTLASSIYSSSAAVHDGVVYIGTENGYLVANTTNGEALWAIALGDKVRGSPMLLDQGIVITYLDYEGPSVISGGLACVDYDGNLLWKTDLGKTPASAALTENGIVVMNYTSMIMVDLDGSIVWKLDIGTSFGGAAPTSVGGAILAVTNELNSRLIMVSDEGDILFQEILLPAQNALSAPTVSDGLAFVATDSGNVYAYRLNSVAPAIAAFTSSTDGLAASFSASAFEGAGPFTYIWNFGDGDAATGQQADHAYAKAGLYTVVLNVFDPQGELKGTVHNEVNVTATLAGTTPTPDETPDELPIWALGLVIVVIAVIIAVAVFVMRKKK